MDAPTKPTGPYTRAEEWIDADAAWQQSLCDTGGKKPRLDDPPPSMFHGNLEEHVQYATAEAWFAEHAAATCSKHPEMTVGFCHIPNETQFASTLEYERATILHAQRTQEYKEQIRKYRNRDAENDRKREQYVEDNETEEGREKLRKKMKQDQENKTKRMLKPAAEGMCTCPVGPHEAPEADFFFDPVEDLGMTNYKGSRDRTVRRGVCKKHFCKTVMRTRRFNAKPTRKLYNHQREQLVWVKDRRKQWLGSPRRSTVRTRGLSSTGWRLCHATTPSRSCGLMMASIVSGTTAVSYRRSRRCRIVNAACWSAIVVSYRAPTGTNEKKECGVDSDSCPFRRTRITIRLTYFATGMQPLQPPPGTEAGSTSDRTPAPCSSRWPAPTASPAPARTCRCATGSATPTAGWCPRS